MSEENRRRVETAVEGDEIDLDTDPTEELDAAMKEALEAIESSARREGSEAGEAPPSEVSDESPDDVARLRGELAEQRERALRAMADLENYRKRVQRERRDEVRFKAFEPLRDFLAVVDNLERALASAGSVDDLKQGVSMIVRQMKNLLRDHGVERIEALGQIFDPSVHEAVSREEDEKVPEPTVVEELQPGYLMHDRLLRPSVVKVAMPSTGSENGGEDA